MKKYLASFAVLGLLTAASLANAQWSGAGTIYGNAYIIGFDNENSTGVTQTTWKGYQEGDIQSLFDLVIWTSFNDYAAPWYQEAYPAYDFTEEYSVQVEVPAGNYTDVEIESQCDQDPVSTADYITYAWFYNQ